MAHAATVRPKSTGRLVVPAVYVGLLGMLVAAILAARHSGHARGGDRAGDRTRVVLERDLVPNVVGADVLQQLLDEPQRSDVVLPPGRYLVHVPLRIAKGQHISGGGGVVLVNAQPEARPLIVMRDVRDAAIEGVSFIGGGIRLEGVNRDITIRNNRFEAIADPRAPFGNETGIFVAGLLSGAVLSGNEFRDIGLRSGRPTTGSSSAILAYHLGDVTITDNRMADVFQGISIIMEGRAGSGQGVRVADNIIERPLRMGIEAQGRGVTDALFEGNVIEMATRGSEDIAMSIVVDRGATVRNNVVISRLSADGPCAGVGIETAGIATRVAENRISGHWCSAILVHSAAPEHSLIEANLICGHQGSYPAISFHLGQGASTSVGNRISPSCE